MVNFVTSCFQFPFPQVLACVYPECTIDSESAGYLRVADLSELALKIRLPADLASETTSVEMDAGTLTGLACLDTLLVLVDVSSLINLM